MLVFYANWCWYQLAQQQHCDVTQSVKIRYQRQWYDFKRMSTKPVQNLVHFSNHCWFHFASISLDIALNSLLCSMWIRILRIHTVQGVKRHLTVYCYWYVETEKVAIYTCTSVLAQWLDYSSTCRAVFPMSQVWTCNATVTSEVIAGSNVRIIVLSKKRPVNLIFQDCQSSGTLWTSSMAIPLIRPAVL